jgi:succinyl-CoA synthetase beta subunit
MNIHEYQAKELFRKFGVPVAPGILAKTPAAAEAAAKKLKTKVVVVKAQVHAGGRGKAGGIKLCKSPADAKAAAKALLGTRLVTKQTTAHGQPIESVYVEAGTDIARELYLALLLDRSSSRLVMMCSTEGGMDIEEVAEKHPNKIFKETIDPLTGLMPYQARNLAFALGLKGDEVSSGVKFMLNLYKMYMQTDASMIEINPLAVTKQGEVVPIDGKVAFDDNGLFRHPDLAKLDDPAQQDAREVEAKKYDLNYVGLEGTIGCMVNGAGLAMATMDIIKHFGGEPANFLDVGGGASEEKVEAAFKLILRDDAVKGILVAIFGGIMKCDTIANGVVKALSKAKRKVPVVCWLEGTNVDLGKKIMKESGLPITPADNLADGTQKILAATKGKK